MEHNNGAESSALGTTSEESGITDKILKYGRENNLFPDFQEKLLNTLNSLKKGREIFLALSEELTNVRDRNDLVSLFLPSSGNIFGNFRISIGLIDGQHSVYTPFCFSPYQELNEKQEGNEIQSQYFPLSEFLTDSIFNSPGPVTFDMAELITKAKIPDHIKAYHELGMRSGLIVPLKSKMETIGFIQVWADRDELFEGGFKEIMLGISPQISNVVSNILLNEDASQKKIVNANLISLSNELVSVRHKRELLNTLNKGLRKMFNFSHTALALINLPSGQYNGFLTGQETEERDITKFSAALAEKNEIKDGIIDLAMDSPLSMVFDSNNVELKGSPLWYRFNYALGIRETLVKILPMEDSRNCFAIMLFSDHKGTFDHSFKTIVERIADQLSSVTANIDTNEKLYNREREKTFLLDFSIDIARVKSKEDLFLAVKRSLKKLNPVKMYAIAKINEDGKTVSSYFHDAEAPTEHKAELREIEKAKFLLHDGIQERILANSIPIILSIEDEIQRGNAPKYLHFWKKMGFEKIVGTALRTGSTELGILWVGMDEINPALLKGICAQISIAMSNIIANEQVLEYKRSLEIENNDLHEQIKTFYNFSEIIGNGAEMHKIYNLINIVAPSDTTVMIMGETGTGKELIARAIHNTSPRKTKLIVKVNCAALPANLIESELFGHEKGSFTGAYERRVGKFELADEGTIFLDEIGEMPLDLQVKLLRVLQEREFERIGGKNTIKVNVRIIAATNRDLLAEVNAGRFRSDLFYRLNVFPMQLPPLRARLEDIEPLAIFFAERYSKLNGMSTISISPTVLQQLRGYTWPGNVRELEHLIERSILLSKDNVLREVDLPVNPPEITGSQWTVVHTALHDAERAYILEVLKGCNGKISGTDGAAELLDIPASTLHSKMKKLGISRIHYAGG